MNIIKNRIKGTIRFENLGKKGKIKIVKTDDSIVITVTYDENENTIFYNTTTIDIGKILSDIYKTIGIEFDYISMSNDEYSFLKAIVGFLENIGIRTDPIIKSVDTVNIKVSNMVIDESKIFNVDIIDKYGTHLFSYIKDNVICSNEDAIAIAIGEYYKDRFSKIKLFINDMVLKLGCKPDDVFSTCNTSLYHNLINDTDSDKKENKKND